jgi:hypothetical protein
MKTAWKLRGIMIKTLTYLFVWLCIPLLIVIAWLAKQETDYLRDEASRLYLENAELTMRVDGMEERMFYAGYEVERLADRILDTCITDIPRPLKKKGKK